MKLYLAIAVLMLAFAVLTEAKELSFEQEYEKLTEKLTEMAKEFSAKAKDIFANIQASDIATQTRTWFNNVIAILQKKIGELRQ